MMSGNIWIIDTETTGLPPRREVPSAERVAAGAWDECRMVQIAWRLYAAAGTAASRATLCSIVRPNGFEIPEGATKIHGISTERACVEGKDIAEIVGLIEVLLPNIDLVVAHNVDFDVAVVAAELYRAGRADMADTLLRKPTFCTMKRGTPQGERWQRLGAMYERVFKRPADAEGKLHDANTDVELCSQLYFAMR